MRIALTLVALAASMPAWAQPAQATHLFCHKTGERIGGLTKTCYYDCGAWEGGLQKYVYDHCQDWTVRWRLNRDSQYGPRTRRTATD